MSMNSRLAYYLRPCLYVATLLATTYALTVGGTFAGIIIPEFREVSLWLITAFVVTWMIIVWRVPHKGYRWSALWPALLLWAIAYLPAITKTPTARVFMGTWYAGFYAGMWLILADLRARGLPGRWVLDSVLFVSLLLIPVSLAQVVEWYPEWWKIRDLPVHLVPPRPSAVYGNPNALATFLVVAIPIGMARAIGSSRVLFRFGWWLWSGIALFTLYLTYSRGAWLAAGGGLLLLAVLVRGKSSLQKGAWPVFRGWRSPRRREIVGGFGLVLGLVILMVLAAQAFDTPRRDLGTRVTLFSIALDIWHDHPWTGSGPFTYGLHMQEQLSIPPNEPQVNAHSLFLNVSAELGVLGLVALLLTLGLIAYHLWQRLATQGTHGDYAQQAGCSAALFAVGIHSTVDMTLMTPALMMLVLAILAVSIESENPRSAGDEFPRRSQTILFRDTMLLVWVGLLVSAWWSMGVYKEFTRGERAVAAGEFSVGIGHLARAVEQQPGMALYWAEYGYATGLAASSGDERWLPQGIDAYRRALALEGSHAVWWANLAALFWQSGEMHQAVEAMHQAVKYAPDFPDFWLNLGVLYETQDMLSEAQDAYTHVLDLNQDWGYAQFWQTTAVRRAVVIAYAPELTPFMRAEALVEQGDWEEALRVLKADIGRDPAQPLPYIRIARLYIEHGRPEQADEYLRAAQLLVHNDQGWAWIAYINALLARDESSRQAYLAEARRYLWQDSTGSFWLYGLNVSFYQFVRDKVHGCFLPQLTILGPHPDLVELLGESS